MTHMLRYSRGYRVLRGEHTYRDCYPQGFMAQMLRYSREDRVPRGEYTYRHFYP